MFRWTLLQAVCALLVCLSVAYEDDIEVNYPDLYYNEIPQGETTEPTPSPAHCGSSDLTKWDKMFSMLENSQMRENMLLQYADDIIKVQMGSLRNEMLSFVAQYGGSCGAAVETAGRRMALLLESRLRETLERLKLGDHASPNGNSAGKVLRSSRQKRLPAGCEMALLFPMRSRRIVTSVAPDVPLSVSSFTVCMWVKPTTVSNKTVLFSYGNRRNPYEIQLLLSQTSILFTIGGEAHLVEAQGVVNPGQWNHLCGSWSSEEGLANLWADGKQVTSIPGVAEGHVLPDGGTLQLGQEGLGSGSMSSVSGFEGRFDPKLAFAGKMTGVNMWDRVLSEEEISQIALWDGQGCEQRGSMVAWGVTEMVPHGGAQFIF